MEFKLTNNQQRIFKQVEETFDNVLIHGKPGVGKSVLIRALTEEGNKTYTLTAPTGLAALNINGRTLHSIFRIPVSNGIIQQDFDKFNTTEYVVNAIRYGIKALIIDEISMVRADQFDFVDRYMQYCKGNTKPFGGVQVILVGDFFQLPPIVSAQEAREFTAAGYDSPFVFDSKVFPGNFRVSFLDEVLRQVGDDDFIDLLDTVRVGRPLFSQLKALNKQIGKREPLTIALTGRNKQAEDINYKELRKLAEPSIFFQADVFGEWKEMPCDERLEIRIGAEVMVKKNGADKPPGMEKGFESVVVNGTLGKVVEIFEGIDDDIAEAEGKPNYPYVIIEMRDGTHVKIYRKRWEKKIKFKDEDGKWDEKIVASFEQMPLALAWAISMHKSQGQSFDRVYIDATSIFAPGQMYVALSRARSLKGITFKDALTGREFWANPNVLRFNKKFEDV